MRGLGRRRGALLHGQIMQRTSIRFVSIVWSRCMFPGCRGFWDPYGMTFFMEV